MRILYLHSSKPLLAFADACLALTPKVFLFKDKAIYLDIEVTKKYFGGEAKILEKFHSLRTEFGQEMKAVLTDRPEWAKVFAADSDLFIPEGQSYSTLLKLPVDSLIHFGDPGCLEEEKLTRMPLIAFMKRVGLQTIADFANLNPTAIGRRFGKPGILLHQWVTGTRELCLTPFIPEPSIVEFTDTEDIGSVEALLLEIEKNIK